MMMNLADLFNIYDRFNMESNATNSLRYTGFNIIQQLDAK